MSKAADKHRFSQLGSYPGDITGVGLENDVFCYLRLYHYGHGVLPFLSRGRLSPLSQLPSLTPRFFVYVWLWSSDSTPLYKFGHIPFESEQEAWGMRAYSPPDKTDDCYKIMGIVNGTYKTVRTKSEQDIAGLELFQRHQLKDLQNLIFQRHKEWDYIQGPILP